KMFLGKHDFLSFSTSEVEDTIREVNSIKIFKKKNIIEIYINGNGFLRSMVRMLVAAMMNYSQDKISLEKIKWLLDNPKKGASIEKAKACGLYLERVYYENNNK
ncbi:MAG: tRNA pseudouridine(38-40) synthase TruA, partial [Ureaplasma sp.]|nr:tRNA pseudouridine(38-40) synthase TruA [Ureaplasma sp.]